MQQKKKHNIRFKQIVPYIFILPAFVVFTIYLFIPLINAFIMSFYDWNIATHEFVGLENYLDLLHDKLFKTTLINTLVYTLAVPVKVVLALGIAALLSSVERFQSFYRSTLFFPFILSGVVVGLIWQMMFPWTADLLI